MRRACSQDLPLRTLAECPLVDPLRDRTSCRVRAATGQDARDPHVIPRLGGMVVGPDPHLGAKLTGRPYLLLPGEGGGPHLSINGTNPNLLVSADK